MTQPNKSILSFLFLAMIFNVSISLPAQEKEFSPHGTPLFKVYADYRYDFTTGAQQRSAFELKRTYFGYKYQFSPDFRARVTFDVGNNSGGSAFTAFLKYAYLDWKALNWLELSAGMIELPQHQLQENAWGHRYIYKSFQDQHGMSSSAGLGATAVASLTGWLNLQLTVSNGEGYKKVQDDYGLHKVSLNLEARPVKGLTLKLYGDQMNKGGTFVNPNDTSQHLPYAEQQSLSAFAVYTWRNRASAGVEYSFQQNHKNMPDQSLGGISAFAWYQLNSQWELFARFDQLGSTTMPGDPSPWNIAKDGSLILTGIQFNPVKGVKMALNYQQWNPADPAVNFQRMIYLNLEYKL